MTDQELKFTALNHNHLKTFIERGPELVFERYINAINGILGFTTRINFSNWRDFLPENYKARDYEIYRATCIFFDLLSRSENLESVKDSLLRMANYNVFPEPETVKGTSAAHFDIIFSTIFMLAGVDELKTVEISDDGKEKVRRAPDTFDARKKRFIQKFGLEINKEYFFKTTARVDPKEEKKLRNQSDESFFGKSNANDLQKFGANLFKLLTFSQRTRNKTVHDENFIPTLALAETQFFIYSCITTIYFILENKLEAGSVLQDFKFKKSYNYDVTFVDIESKIEIDGDEYSPINNTVIASLRPFVKHALKNKGREDMFYLDEYSPNATITPPNHIKRHSFIFSFAKSMFETEHSQSMESVSKLMEKLEKLQGESGKTLSEIEKLREFCEKLPELNGQILRLSDADHEDFDFLAERIREDAKKNIDALSKEMSDKLDLVISKLEEIHTDVKEVKTDVKDVKEDTSAIINHQEETNKILAEMKKQMEEMQKKMEQMGKTQKSNKIIVGGHEAVDLGLSVKWATCNIGAERPEEYGGYYNLSSLGIRFQYIPRRKSEEYFDSKNNLKAEFDVATDNWGKDWRLPTKSEFEELLDNVNVEWKTINEINGLELTSKINGESIFLPFSGVHYSDTIFVRYLRKNIEATYVSSSSYLKYINDKVYRQSIYCLTIRYEPKDYYFVEEHPFDFSIRPVTDK